MTTKKHNDDKKEKFDITKELEKAKREREAFIAQAQQRIAWLDGRIALLEELAQKELT